MGSCELQPALLVPGYTGSKEDFIAVLQTLAHAGRTVVAIDMPGQYESPGFGHADGYTLQGLGEVVTALTETLEHGPLHLLGHSFGGLVTRETVLGGQAKLLSYAAMSSGPARVDGERAADARNLVTALETDPTRERLAELWERNLDGPARESGVPEEVYHFLRTRMLANDPAGLAGMGTEILSAPDRTAELAAVDLPKLVLYGENDTTWPPEVQAVMAQRLSADRVVIPGSAHSPNVEAPETTASALNEFWNRAEAPEREI